MYHGTVIEELDAMLERRFGADQVLARQVLEWWQEMDPHFYGKPCWMRQNSFSGLREDSEGDRP